MSTTSFAIPLATSPRHPTNSFSLCYPHDGDPEHISYRFTVIREEPRCRWHLPLWLLFFGVTVSILTLLFLLTGTVYPIHGWWTSHSLGVLKIAEGIYRAGHPSAAINDSTSHPLAPISYGEPDHVFARSTRNGDFSIPSAVMRRPSKSGPASLVDNSLSLLVQVRIPDTPRDARCMITSGVTLTRHLESAGKAARIQLWSLAGIMPDVSTSGGNRGLRREAHVSSFDVRPGEMPVQRSAEFACPPSRSIQTFEVSCADEDDGCSVEVWQGLFRVEVRA